MKNLLVIYIILFVFVTFLSMGCTKKNEAIPLALDTTIIPCQEVGASTIYGFEGSFMEWRLISDYSFKTLDDTSSMLVVPVRMTFFDSLGDSTTVVLSDSGNTKTGLSRFFLWGNVFVKNYDGLKIRSESLWWDKATKKIGSDDHVQITTPEGDVLRGKGLDATESFSWWVLKENVKGTFPNFKDRMGSDEEFK